MRKKFTLIELLIVIAVIAILLALLLPALQSAKQKVYTASCVNSMRQIGQAIYLYINDNNDYPPAPYEWANYMLNGNYIPSRNTTKSARCSPAWRTRIDGRPIRSPQSGRRPVIPLRSAIRAGRPSMIHTGGDMTIGGNPVQRYTVSCPMRPLSVKWHTAAKIPISTIQPTSSCTI